jgi:molybdate transport system permease protein
MSFKKFSIFSLLIVFLIYLVLFTSLFFYFDSKIFISTLFTSRVLFSIKISLCAALLASMFSIFLALPTGYALSRYKFFGSQFIDLILEFPLVASPAALGASILIFLNSNFGSWIENHFISFVFSFSGVVLAQFITVLGTAVRLIKTTIDTIPIEYELMARTLGKSPFYVFCTIVFPLASRGVLVAWIMTFTKALGEFGATIMVAGTIAYKTETLPISIFLKLSSADIQATVALILLLLSLGFCMLILMRVMNKRENTYV